MLVIRGVRLDSQLFSTNILLAALNLTSKKVKGCPVTCQVGKEGRDLGPRTGWSVSAMPWPIYPRERDPVPIVQEAGWASQPVRIVPPGVELRSF